MRNKEIIIPSVTLQIHEIRFGAKCRATPVIPVFIPKTFSRGVKQFYWFERDAMVLFQN